MAQKPDRNPTDRTAAATKSGAAKPHVAKPVAKLANQLLDLDQEVRDSRRKLRQLDARIAKANDHRRRILELTGALLRHGFKAELGDLGAESFDIAGCTIDTSYDGLLISLVQELRRTGAVVQGVLVVTAEPAGMPLPLSAAEFLHLPCRRVAVEEAADMLEEVAGAVLVAEAGQLLAAPRLPARLLDGAICLIAVLTPGDAATNAALREQARQLIAHVEKHNLEVIHVSGAGDQIAFARKGLLAPGRCDGFSADGR